MADYKPILTRETINPLVLEAKYAVRGAVPSRANQIAEELRGEHQWPFNEVIYCNIGNPQQLGQQPLTFFRQVCSLVICPALLQHPKVKELFPGDVIERTALILKNTPGGVGAYSHSQGLEFVRKDVAEFISKRDNSPCDHRSIFLTQGASPGIQTLMNLIIRKPTDGILTPTPQYPLYTGTLSLYGGRSVPYYLQEKTGWSLSVESMRQSVESAKELGIETRAVVVINPGNPTGACLSEDNVLEILRFAHNKGLVVLADEVYQTNIYNKAEKPFISFRSVLKRHEDELKGLELVSFNSVSKGLMGECGIRGGYFQMENIQPEVSQEILKLASLSLCPNLIGQVIVDLMVKPPKEGDESYELFKKENDRILASLITRAKMLTEALDSLECCSCQPVESSMYAFPQIILPPKFVEYAQEKGVAADELYCLSLLESEGLCCVPGSGFGQERNTYHLRTTILPSEEHFSEITNKFAVHHKKLLEKYATKEWIQEKEAEMQEEKVARATKRTAVKSEK